MKQEKDMLTCENFIEINLLRVKSSIDSLTIRHISPNHSMTNMTGTEKAIE